MTRDPQSRDLDALLDAARAELREPPDFDPTALVPAASLAGRARHRRRTAGRLAAAAALAGGALAAVAVLAIRPSPAPPAVVAERGRAAPVANPSPSVLDEPAGVPSPSRAGEPPEATSRTTFRTRMVDGRHVLVVAPGAGLAIEDASVGARVRLHRGAALFDVRPLDRGERFEVVTPHGTVRVLGTVFAVASSAGGLSVRVFEGRVAVERAGGRTTLRAGQALGEGHGGIEALEPFGRRAAATRRRGRPASAAPRADTGGTSAAAEPTLADARGWIASGEPARALEEARARADGASGTRWRGVAADALRALGRHREAAAAFDALARDAGDADRARFGFLAAELRLRRLADPSGARVSLHLAGVTSPSSPLRERGLALELEALDALNDHAAFEARAAEYLDAFARGSRRAWVRSRRAAHRAARERADRATAHPPRALPRPR